MFKALQAAALAVGATTGSQPVTAAEVLAQLQVGNAAVASPAAGRDALLQEGRALRVGQNGDIQEAPQEKGAKPQGSAPQEKPGQDPAVKPGSTASPSAADSLIERARARRAAAHSGAGAPAPDGSARPVPEQKSATEQRPSPPAQPGTASNAGARPQVIPSGTEPANKGPSTSPKSQSTEIGELATLTPEAIAAMSPEQLSKAIVALEKANTATRDQLAVAESSIRFRSALQSRIDQSAGSGPGAQLDSVTGLRAALGARRDELDKKAESISGREKQAGRLTPGVPNEVVDQVRDVNNRRAELVRRLDQDSADVSRRQGEIIRSYRDRVEEYNRRGGLLGGIIGGGPDPSSANDPVAVELRKIADPRSDKRYAGDIATGTKQADPAAVSKELFGTGDLAPSGTREELAKRLSSAQTNLQLTSGQLTEAEQTVDAQKKLIRKTVDVTVADEAERLATIDAHLSSVERDLARREENLGAGAGLSDAQRMLLRQWRQVADRETDQAVRAVELAEKSNGMALDEAGRKADDTLREADRKRNEGPIKVGPGGIRIGFGNN